MMIDFLLIELPLIAIELSLPPVSKTVASLLVVPMTAGFLGYSIYCHGRFGRTLGKRIMRIRVVKTNGAAISWREAWLRNSVEVGGAVFAVIGTFIALATIPHWEYYDVDWYQRGLNLRAYEPDWLAWTEPAMRTWALSEIVVMLFNEQRRALHDMIAGTIVIADESASKP